MEHSGPSFTALATVTCCVSPTWPTSPFPPTAKKSRLTQCLDVPKQTVEHLYLNQVLPLALSRQFKFVLHASAVEIGNFAVAFMGVSGQGKSTLATSFATSGHRFLTDDGLQLEKGEDGYLIQPSHPSIRLWDDSRLALMPETAQTAPPVDFTPKSRFLADDEVAYCDEARPLRCLYFLGEGDTDTVSIEPVSGRDAMIELVRHSFLLDIEAREMLMHHFGQLTELARIPMFFRAGLSEASMKCCRRCGMP